VGLRLVGKGVEKSQETRWGEYTGTLQVRGSLRELGRTPGISAQGSHGGGYGFPLRLTVIKIRLQPFGLSFIFSRTAWCSVLVQSNTSWHPPANPCPIKITNRFSLLVWGQDGVLLK